MRNIIHESIKKGCCNNCNAFGRFVGSRSKHFSIKSITTLHEEVRDVSKKIDGHISWHLDDKKKSR